MKRFFSVLLIFSLLSCNSETERFETAISKIFPEINNSSIDYVVIIPNQGCGGCITSAEEFYNGFSDCKNVRFIFTNILSAKILKMRFEINPNNTYLDMSNDILKVLPPEVKIYPCIISFDEGEVDKVTYQSPQEDGFSMIDYKRLIHE